MRQFFSHIKLFSATQSKLVVVLLWVLLSGPAFSLRAQDCCADTCNVRVEKPVLALSTNLLYDLAITPNFAVEVPLGRQWSLYGEYTFPWWVTRDNSRAWQILKADLGVRYWISRHKQPMDVLSGHFIGLDAAIGYYDIEPHHTGWQGEAVAAMLEYGYAWKLGKKKRWRLDLFLGVGWMGTKYRYYQATEDDRHLLYQYSGRMGWFGPTKVGVSIKYVIPHQPKQKNGKKEKKK